MVNPEHFVDDYLPALLTQASHVISGEFHRIAKARGLTVSEWRVLATLSSHEPMSIGQLARITVTQQPTLTAVLARMEPRGLVKRVAHESDRRVSLVRLTPAGQRLSAKMIELAREHERRVLEPFGHEPSSQLKAILRRLIELHGSLEDET